MCLTNKSPDCWGNPAWLTDAAGFNTNLLWAPEGCKYRFYTPPMGPQQSCLRAGAGTGFLLLVGDSVTREYAKACLLFNLRPAKLVCQFANIALEGQHYSRDYADAVARTIVDNIVNNNAATFATNLGIHHMIGPCSTAQWAEFVGVFVDKWRARVVWAKGADPTAAGGAGAGEKKNTSYPGGKDPRLEAAVWLGPPTIHYARKGMGAQRAQQWDEIAWAALGPLGFRRLHALTPTRARQEATWDGLHYAAERGKRQTRQRNKAAKAYHWNGGVANMLFTMLLNVLCNSPAVAPPAPAPAA
jgi:hypothetical protein